MKKNSFYTMKQISSITAAFLITVFCFAAGCSNLKIESESEESGVNQISDQTDNTTKETSPQERTEPGEDTSSDGSGLIDYPEPDLEYLNNSYQPVLTFEPGYYYGCEPLSVVRQKLADSSDRQNVKSGAYLKSGLYIGMKVEEVVKVYGLNKTNALIQANLLGKVYNYYFENYMETLNNLIKSAQWVDIEQGWYSDEDDVWHRMTAEEIHALNNKDFDTPCKYVFCLSLSISQLNDPHVSAFMVEYGTLEDYYKFEGLS